MTREELVVALGDPFLAWRNAERGDDVDAGRIQVWTQGQAWLGDVHLTEQGLADWWASTLAEAKTTIEQRLKRGLRELNGTFAVVAQRGGMLVAAVDRIRSIPLFYGCREGSAYIVSDDARRVRDFVGASGGNEQTRMEFLLLGYVTGNDTLSPSVRQLRPGEWLQIEATGEGPALKLQRYYRFLHERPCTAPAEDLLPTLDGILVGTFERLVEASQDRTLVVPLSGGLDSRLICVMLKRLGIDRVICYSYGRPGNRESRTSEAVAATLGYRWHFVPYSRKSWAEWFQSSERKAYYRYCDGLCSLPISQDWPAVWQMMEQGLIPQDSLFVPGHTGDFVSGKHIPRGIYARGAVGQDLLVQEILKKHYTLWDWGRHQERVEERLADRIEAQIGGFPAETPEQAASTFEAWEWQERQAKFIVNSVRAYEFWGYGWSLPFWDREVMGFWSGIPLALRKQQSLYRGYLASVHGGFFPECQPGEPGSPATLRRADRRLQVGAMVRRYQQRIRHYLADYYRHPMAWYGIHGWREHLLFSTSAGRLAEIGLPEDLSLAWPQNINAYLALEYLSAGFPER